MKRGRPKGYTPYTDITYEELGDWVGRRCIVKVSKTWLDELMEANNIDIEEVEVPVHETPLESSEKIEFTITNFNE